MQKKRLDTLMVEKGLVEDRNQAQKLVMAGQVRVAGQLVVQPGESFLPDVSIQVSQRPRYVSRGGEKLEAGLQAFGLEDLRHRICADVGASTGGFTDCLLQHGAQKVFSIDVGYGELHWKLRNDRRVVVMERTNARFLDHLSDPVTLVTIDASFISLKVLLPTIKTWFSGVRGDIVALIKPQFEAGRSEVSRGEGVIYDQDIHRRVLQETLSFASGQGFGIQGLIRSPLKGPKGNIEFLAYLIIPPDSGKEWFTLVDRVMDEIPGE